jgi:hypothetical protein
LGSRYSQRVRLDRCARCRCLPFNGLINLNAPLEVDYLTKYRLQWGRPDTLSKLKSTVDDSVKDLTTPPPSNPPKEWFTVDTPPEMISIIQNDWPYSGIWQGFLSRDFKLIDDAVPADVEHTLIWTKLPIMHPTLIEPSIAPRIDQDGLCGFTGATTPPPPPDALPACLPALAEWGVTLESLIRSAPPSATEAVHIATAGREVHEFVRARWSEREWETAWFVNPQVRFDPRLACASLTSYSRDCRACRVLRIYTCSHVESLRRMPRPICSWVTYECPVYVDLFAAHLDTVAVKASRADHDVVNYEKTCFFSHALEQPSDKSGR